MLPLDPYKLDDTFVTKGWVQVAEGKKGEKARQWGDNSHENYLKIDPEAQQRTLEFIERNAKAGKAFYVANWPNLTSFIPNPKKCSTSRSILQDGLQCNIDPFVGKVMDKLKELGMNPKKFGKLANHKQEPWKAPLPDFIESLYFKRFRKEHPDQVKSIERIVKDRNRKKEEKKLRKKLEREDPIPF